MRDVSTPGTAAVNVWMSVIQPFVPICPVDGPAYRGK
jgi:hypothetical protein